MCMSMSIPLSITTFTFLSESDHMPDVADMLRQHGIIKDMSMMSQTQDIADHTDEHKANGINLVL